MQGQSMKRPTHRGSWDAPSVVVAWVVGLLVLLVLLAPYELHSRESCFRLSQSQPPAVITHDIRTKPTTSSPVVVAHPGISWWVLDFGPHWQVPGCSHDGKPLDCQYVSTAHASGNSTAQDLLGQAQALVHEGCWDPATIPPQFRSVTQVMFSMEPVTNWPCLDRQVADIEMSYRTCSQVWTPYWPWMDTAFGAAAATAVYRDPALRQPPLRFDQKVNAIIYINTQCAAKSGRQNVIRQLVSLLKASNSTLALHSFGKCDPNMPKADMDKFGEGDTGSTRQGKKLEYFRHYKFCITMENSVARDYVTEKVYHGLIAGCVPIYLGAPNVADYIPDSNAIIDYAKLGTPEALKAELERLASDREAYEGKLRWKVAAERHWTPGFRGLLAYSEQHPLCGLCKHFAERNLNGGGHPSTLCSANTSWQQL